METKLVTTIALVFPLLMLLCLAGCTRRHANAPSPFLAQHIGEHCTVQFRRDALGSGAPLPVSPLTNGINGADVSMGGELLAAEGDGIVIQHSHNGRIWIPNHAILLIEFSGGK
jgi:hypothetical protein